MKKTLNILNKNIKRKNDLKGIFVFFVGLFFLSDFITKILIVYDFGSFNRIAGVIKLVFEIYMIVMLLKKRKINRVLILGLFLLGVFVISNLHELILHTEGFSYNVILDNIYYVNRYLYIFLFIGFLKSYEVSFERKNNFIKLFKTVLYINCYLIILGLIFEIELFRSYPYSNRFGYDGFLSKHGEAAYYFIFFITILYYEYINNKTPKKLFKLLVVSLVSILLGKKAVLLFLVLLILLHFTFVVKRIKEVVATVLISGAFIFFCNEALSELLFKIFPYWEEIRQRHDLLATITSTRSDLFKRFINDIAAEWETINYFFGIGEYERLKVEFEFVDVFMFFGLIGVLIFLLLFKKYFYNKENKLSTYLLLSVLITSFFSGALFISVTSMMYFYVVFQWINSSE